MAIGKGFGKIILFGEHFVVYGLPGIASGIDKYVKVCIEKTKEKDIFFIDKNFQEIIQKNNNPSHILCQLWDVMFKNLELNSIKITISGNCLPKSGMGYSAALNVALARALNNYLKLNWSHNKINKIAYEGEKLIHGNPSGIDNTCATFNSLILFKKNKIIKLQPGKKLFFVIGDTGIRRDTKKIINLVHTNKIKNKKEFKNIFFEEEKLLTKAKLAIKRGNIKEIGLLMNKNQNLLKKIEVSCKKLEKLIKIALENGALGAKLTGAGRGGLMIALCSDKKNQQKIIKEFKKFGFEGLNAEIKNK